MARDGLVAIGSRGQTRLHPALAELRQSRALLLKMLDGLKLPQDSGVIRSGGTRRRPATLTPAGVEARDGAPGQGPPAGGRRSLPSSTPMIGRRRRGRCWSRAVVFTASSGPARQSLTTARTSGRRGGGGGRRGSTSSARAPASISTSCSGRSESRAGAGREHGRRRCPSRVLLRSRSHAPPPTRRPTDTALAKPAF